MIWTKKGAGSQRVTLDDLVEEALCFGWIDSRLRPLDEKRSALMFTPRRKGGVWSRRNKQRVAELAAQGLMTEAGQRVVDVAKRDGSWELADAVEDLRVPNDLARALAASPEAELNFNAFSPSARKMALWWIVSAKREDTRARRVAETVRLAGENIPVSARRPRHPSS